MALTIIMGVPGAGKSTVLAAAKEKNFPILNYGDLMFEIASAKKYVAHRDELRKLPPETQQIVQSEVGKKLAKISSEKENTILDTHCSISTPKGYLPGLPLLLLSSLKVRQLVLVTAPVSEIIGRRKADTSRVRDSETPESLQAHENWNKFLLAAYSVVSGAPAEIIVNANGKLELAQKKLLSLMQ